MYFGFDFCYDVGVFVIGDVGEGDWVVFLLGVLVGVVDVGGFYVDESFVCRVFWNWDVGDCGVFVGLFVDDGMYVEGRYFFILCVLVLYRDV